MKKKADFVNSGGLFESMLVHSKPERNLPQPKIPDTGWELPTEFPSLAGQGMISIDVETYDPDILTKGPGSFRDGYMVGVAVGTEAGFRQYYPVKHKGYPNCDRDKVYGWLSEQLTRESQPKVGANLPYDLEYLWQEGVKVEGPFYDVQIAEPLINENKLVYSLESLGQQYLNEGKQEDELDKWNKLAFERGTTKGNIYRMPPAVVGPYAISDIDLPLRIFRKQKRVLEQQNLWELFVLESKLLPILLKMRFRGIKVDLVAAENASKAAKETCSKILKTLKTNTGFSGSIWEAESLSKLYDAAGVSYPKTDKTKKPSFKKEWLETDNNPLSALIRDARDAEKFSTTFLDGYIINGNINGRLHTNFRQLKGDAGGTVSGRLSSASPNLQNIPSRDESGALIRAMFVPDEGQLMYSLDFSQVEYRILGHYAYITRQPGADLLAEIYRNDPSADFHKTLAEATNLDRGSAKTLNFGLVYGLGVPALCSKLNLSEDAGVQLISDYHVRAPYLKPLLTAVKDKADRSGEIITLLGRHRRFDTWEKRSYNDKGETVMLYSHKPMAGYKRAFTRNAFNSLVQGSAADVMKKSMVDVYESGVTDVIGVPSLTVHDELVGSFPDTKEGWEAIKEMKNIMETCVDLVLPLIVDLGTGRHWGEAK